MVLLIRAMLIVGVGLLLAAWTHGDAENGNFLLDDGGGFLLDDVGGKLVAQ